MRSRKFDISVTIVCLSLLSYFGWHAYEGPRGYPYRDQLAAKEAVLLDRFAKIDGERQKLEHRVALLRPDSIDPDLLDELARSQLDYARPSDVVVFLPGEIR